MKNMNRTCVSLVTLVLGLGALMPFKILAQDDQMKDRVAEIKLAVAFNKQSLSKYTWQEQQTTSVKGEVKKQEQYQVRVGPDGKPQKTEIGAPEQTSDGGRKHGLRHRIEEEKKEEFQEYGEQIASLAQSYAKPDPDRIQQAYQQGNVMVGPTGTPNQIRLVIKNYLKQGDSLTFIFDRARKVVQSIEVSSYLDDPNNAVTISAQFAQLPDGTNHISNMVVNGVSKQLTVNIQNSDYQMV